MGLKIFVKTGKINFSHKVLFNQKLWKNCLKCGKLKNVSRGTIHKTFHCCGKLVENKKNRSCRPGRLMCLCVVKICFQFLLLSPHK